MVDVDVLSGAVTLTLFEVNEPSGEITWDGSPGTVRSVLVYAETDANAIDTAAEILGLPDDVDLVARECRPPDGRMADERATR